MSKTSNVKSNRTVSLLLKCTVICNVLFTVLSLNFVCSSCFLMSFIFTKYVLKNLYHLYLYDDFLTCAFVSNSNMDQ